MEKKVVYCDITGDEDAENFLYFAGREFNGIENEDVYKRIDLSPFMACKILKLILDAKPNSSLLTKKAQEISPLLWDYIQEFKKMEIERRKNKGRSNE